MLKSTKLNALAMTMATAIVAAAPRLASACATCGLADGDQAFHAYKTSVLFMLVSPYASFAAIGGIAYFAYRRSQRKDQNSTTK
ncbi:MAG TPA: hypothetical protein VNT29_06005 [Candidatus Limnocylindrales bacterium]|nr:hypothetical protein [Candidatus Limnocylindrales bacterium]